MTATKWMIILIACLIGIVVLRYLIEYWVTPFMKKYRGNAKRTGLYKGKDGQGEWHVGYLQQSFGLIRQCVRIRELGLFRLVPPSDVFGKVLIQKDTLCACTELTDKKEVGIYESDILRLNDKEFTATGIVRFGEYGNSHYGWYIEPIENVDIPQQLLLWTNSADKSCEVIGNEFDNRELLQKKY